MSQEEHPECPLCMEPFEVDDLNFFPCTCGYQICRFCWHRIRTDENGLCPACRKAYPENPADFKPLTQEQVAQMKAEKRHKEQQKKQKATDSRKHLANVRVVQKNLVFVVGLPMRLADTQMLKRAEYFGRFGRIHKVVINQSTAHTGPTGPSASAYVTYHRCDDALRAIQAVNNVSLENRILKTSLGTTKYCSHFIKSQACPKTDCMYLHDFGDPEASFTKEEMQQGRHQDYEKKLHEQLNVLGTLDRKTASPPGNVGGIPGNNAVVGKDVSTGTASWPSLPLNTNGGNGVVPTIPSTDTTVADTLIKNNNNTLNCNSTNNRTKSKTGKDGGINNNNNNNNNNKIASNNNTISNNNNNNNNSNCNNMSNGRKKSKSITKDSSTTTLPNSQSDNCLIKSSTDEQTIFDTATTTTTTNGFISNTKTDLDSVEDCKRKDSVGSLDDIDVIVGLGVEEMEGQERDKEQSREGDRDIEEEEKEEREVTVDKERRKSEPRILVIEDQPWDDGDDDLGFDPFQEGKKIMGDLLENEVQLQQEKLASVTFHHQQQQQQQQHHQQQQQSHVQQQLQQLALQQNGSYPPTLDSQLHLFRSAYPQVVSNFFNHQQTSSLHSLHHATHPHPNQRLLPHRPPVPPPGFASTSFSPNHTPSSGLPPPPQAPLSPTTSSTPASSGPLPPPGLYLRSSPPPGLFNHRTSPPVNDPVRCAAAFLGGAGANPDVFLGMNGLINGKVAEWPESLRALINDSSTGAHHTNHTISPPHNSPNYPNHTNKGFGTHLNVGSSNSNFTDWTALDPAILSSSRPPQNFNLASQQQPPSTGIPHPLAFFPNHRQQQQLNLAAGLNSNGLTPNDLASLNDINGINGFNGLTSGIGLNGLGSSNWTHRLHDQLLKAHAMQNPLPPPGFSLRHPVTKLKHTISSGIDAME